MATITDRTGTPQGDAPGQSAIQHAEAIGEEIVAAARREAREIIASAEEESGELSVGLERRAAVLLEGRPEDLPSTTSAAWLPAAESARRTMRGLRVRVDGRLAGAKLRQGGQEGSEGTAAELRRLGLARDQELAGLAALVRRLRLAADIADGTASPGLLTRVTGGRRWAVAAVAVTLLALVIVVSGWVGAKLFSPEGTQQPAAASPIAAAPATACPIPDRFRAAFEKAAAREQVPLSLLASLASVASEFNPQAVSPDGAIGLFQLMPETAAGLGVNPRKPRQNIRGGAAFLADMLDQFGVTETALAAYRAGPATVRNGTVEPMTEQFVANVMSTWATLENCR